MNVEDALRDFVGLFERLALPYAVMGGLAVRVYGILRPTYDVDVTITLPRGRLPELFSAATTLGYTVPEAYQAGWIDQVAGMPVVKVRRYLEGQGIDVDIFLAECDFQKEMMNRRRKVETEGLTVSIVSPEDLVLLKLLAGRPRDLGDIGDVLFMQGQLDEAYMRSWAARLGTLDALEKVLAEPPAI